MEKVCRFQYAVKGAFTCDVSAFRGKNSDDLVRGQIGESWFPADAEDLRAFSSVSLLLSLRSASASVGGSMAAPVLEGSHADANHVQARTSRAPLATASSMAGITCRRVCSEISRPRSPQDRLEFFLSTRSAASPQGPCLYVPVLFKPDPVLRRLKLLACAIVLFRHDSACLLIPEGEVF